MWLNDRRVYRRLLDNEADDVIREHGERAYSALREGAREARKRGDFQSAGHLGKVLREVGKRSGRDWVDKGTRYLR